MTGAMSDPQETLVKKPMKINPQIASLGVTGLGYKLRGAFSHFVIRKDDNLHLTKPVKCNEKRTWV